MELLEGVTENDQSPGWAGASKSLYLFLVAW